MRAFPVRFRSGVVYWTVVDEDYRVVAEPDAYLQHLRLGRDAAESTTKAYAESVALYLRWCAGSGRDWRTAADRLGGFVVWLRHTPNDPDAPVAGPGMPDVRGPGRINRILAGVRGFLRHGVAVGSVPAGVLPMLFEVSDGRRLPVEARGESGALNYVARPRHRLSEPDAERARRGGPAVVGGARRGGGGGDHRYRAGHAPGDRGDPAAYRPGGAGQRRQSTRGRPGSGSPCPTWTTW
jgi:hypothetical protein